MKNDKNNKISASLMCLDIYNINNDIDIIEKSGIDYLHIDIMDGHFVNNLGLGIDFIKHLRNHTNIPFDYHLMVENPNKIIPMLNVQKSDIISVHFESTYHIYETIDLIKTYGCNLFVAINPETPILILESVHQHINGINFMTVRPGFSGQKIMPLSIDKFKRLKQFLKNISKENMLIEVDGNMNFENAKIFKDLGANIFVAGTSSIFPDYKISVSAIDKYRKLINENI